MIISPEQLAEFERAVRADPGAACFAALAETHRRAGRLGEAEQVARQGLERKPDAAEGRLVLATTLLDQGRSAEAREELERLTSGVLATHGIETFPPTAPTHGDLSESELDDAFEQAETDTDALIDPNRVAEAALAHVDADTDEDEGEGEESVDLEPGSAFATATMARLLEAQGDESGAERIRASLETAAGAETESAEPEDLRRERMIATLSRWLTNLRGGHS